ncbi:MAG TPA: CCA tRNA nucleotidyltransferase, partial [Beijerinckiaceae bacterium]
MSVAQVIDGRLVGAAFLDDPRLRRVLDALDGDGEEARVVGGAVRNALMGEPVTEVDVATTATPDVMLARAKRAGLRAVPTGIDHGTITFIADGEPFEATTLREDVETHGRHATVRFGRDFEADALRRDFTFNALSVDADGRLHDYTGGVADARARRVRFIGDAATRIREDYLRILRFFRFQAAYGDGEIDRDALHAAISLRAGMEGLSRERVLAELVKLLGARGAPRVASLMAETGILIDVTGGVVHGARLAACAAIADARTADPALRLAAACVIVREDAERLRARLRLSNAWENRLVKAADALTPWRGRPAPP